MSKITVSSCFDGGNGEFVKVVPGSPTEVHVNVKDDVHTELEQKYHKQWFYFRVSGCRQGEGNNQLKFVLANAGACSYPTAWAGYNVCASYDHKNWFRVPSEYDTGAGHLHWTMEMTSDQVYFAYFAPYSHERHLDLIAKCNALASSKCPGDLTNRTEVSVRALGNTLDGRSMDLVAIGNNLRCCAAPTVCHALLYVMLCLTG
jgi:murein tripeptide amidase MpaA